MGRCNWRFWVNVVDVQQWRRIDGQALIPLVRAGVRFIDGKQPERDNEEIKIEDSKKAGKIAA